MNAREELVFRAIADPTRREIIHVLASLRAALTINQIVERFPASRQAVTKHIKQLEEAGLLEIRAEGRERYCSANAEPLKIVHDWVSAYEEFWDHKLGALGSYLDQKAAAKKKKRK